MDEATDLENVVPLVVAEITVLILYTLQRLKVSTMRGGKIDWENELAHGASVVEAVGFNSRREGISRSRCGRALDRKMVAPERQATPKIEAAKIIFAIRIDVLVVLIHNRTMKRKPADTKLHQWLEAKGLTDQAFADRMGCERSTITKLRQGLTNPSAQLGVKISNVTKINVRDLMVKEVAG